MKEVFGSIANLVVIRVRDGIEVPGTTTRMVVFRASPGSTWAANQIQARTEGRFDLGVLQPNAIVRVGTAP